MLDTRDHQAALSVNGAAEIDSIEQAHGIAQAVRVDFRELLERFDDSVADEVVDSDIGVDLPFLEGLLGLFAKGLDLPGVSAEHVGELGGVLQGIVHALRDELAHVGHLLDSELGAFSGDIRMRRLPSLKVASFHHAGKTGATRGSLEAALSHHGLGKTASWRGRGGDDITLNDPAARTASRDLVRIHSLLGGETLRPRRDSCRGRLGDYSPCDRLASLDPTARFALRSSGPPS